MSYRLILSACLENAITHHLNEILPQGLFDESLLYIPQNQQTSEWFSSIMSQKTGTILGVNLQITDQALCQLSLGFSCVQQATEYDIPTQKMAKPFLNKNDLQLLLYYKIGEYREHPNLEFVRNYLSKIPSGQQDKHIWILAQNLGSLFYSYAQRSRKLINLWRNNNTLTGHQEPLLETWQRFLWYQCFGKKSPAYNLLGDWLDRIIQGDYHYTGSLRKIILIGTVSLHKVYLDFFQKLSTNISIIHFMLQPIAEHHAHPDWPLLVTHKTMYNRFADYFSIQQPAIVKESIPLPSSLNSKQNSSCLEKLQYTLFTGQTLEDTMEPDHSIRHLSCSDEEREIEVLKDLLLHKLDEDPTLLLSDIAIVAPNIEKYTSYLEAVFDRGDDQSHKLAYNIINANSNADPLFLQAILSLLKLVGGKFTTEEIFELLNNPLVIKRHNINEEDLKIWNDFCKKTHILIGKNKLQRQEQNLGETHLNTFDIGFLRFSLGQVFGDIQTQYGRSLTDISYGLGQQIAKFMYIVEKLYNDFYPLAQVEMSLIQWFNCLEKLFIEHLSYDTEERKNSHTLFFSLRERFRKIQSLPNEDKHISFLVIKEILDNRIRNQIQKGGFLLNDGIICASLTTLRTIPFRIIAVLGLNNDTFPRHTSVHHFDLLQVSTLKDDLFIDDETFHLDHHIFLETLFSARQELWLFHQDRDGITGNKLFSSNSLRDLEMFLTHHIYNTNTLESYKIIFPHNPFAAILFSKNLPLIQSYDPKNYQLAQIVYGQTNHTEQTLTLPLNEHPPWEKYQHNVTAIHTKDFIEFIQNPTHYFLKKTLRITQWQPSLSEIDNISHLHTLSYYPERDLYTQMINSSLCNQDFSWEHFLNIQLTDFLKSGELGERIYSHLYRSHIYEVSLWLMNEIQTIKPDNNCLLRCHLYNQQIGSEFLPCLSHSSTTWNGYFWGELPHIFINYSQKIVYGIYLNHYEESIKIAHLAQIYTQHLLCLPQFIDYQFQIKIFYLKNKKSDTIKLSKDWKLNEFCIRDCIIKNFLFAQKYPPCLNTDQYGNYSMYKKNNKKNSLINIKDQEKCSTQKLFPCEIELEKIFFERILNHEN